MAFCGYLVTVAGFWGVIFGYWLRKRLPTVKDIRERQAMEDELMQARWLTEQKRN